jgi:hypothetical protein
LAGACKGELITGINLLATGNKTQTDHIFLELIKHQTATGALGLIFQIPTATFSDQHQSANVFGCSLS